MVCTDDQLNAYAKKKKIRATGTLSYERNRLTFEFVIRNSIGKIYGRFTTINILKYEHFTRKINKTYSHPVCPL